MMQTRLTLAWVLTLLCAPACSDDAGQHSVQVETVPLKSTGETCAPPSTAVDSSSSQTTSAPVLPKQQLPYPPDTMCLGLHNGHPCGDYALCLYERCVPTSCGDGVKMPYEECEDGNFEDNDGCFACFLERCGDGIIHPGEQCDDGNNIRFDNCDVTCRKTPDNLCGNGVLDPHEQCDDGNADNFDNCRNDCRLAPSPSCGNRQVDNGEQCDDGNHRENDGCSPNCQLEVCGDGFVRALFEQCDDGNNQDGDGCSADCRSELVGVCGNKTVEPGEQCDDANTKNTDDCPNDCQWAQCGDAVREGREECDDGNTQDGDRCDAHCRREVRCGDGIVDFLPGDIDRTEHCDDGNRIDDDRCPNDCKVPVCGDGKVSGAFEECDGQQVPLEGQVCDDRCRILPTCGNGLLENQSAAHPDRTEDCDDGNTKDGDGCGKDCRFQALATCGDGKVDPEEECDDGPLNNTGNGSEGACMAGTCRWAFWDEACSRCMAKSPAPNLCRARGREPCNAVMNCYTETKCVEPPHKPTTEPRGIGQLRCLCGDGVSVSTCQDLKEFTGPCQAEIFEGSYDIRDGKKVMVNLPIQIFAGLSNPARPYGRAGQTMVQMARFCSAQDQCGAHFLPDETPEAPQAEPSPDSPADRP